MLSAPLGISAENTSFTPGLLSGGRFFCDRTSMSISLALVEDSR